MMVHDMKQRRKLLRNVSIRSRLLFGFIALPLVVMIICFLLYDKDRGVLVRRKYHTCGKFVL